MSGDMGIEYATRQQHRHHFISLGSSRAVAGHMPLRLIARRVSVRFRAVVPGSAGLRLRIDAIRRWHPCCVLQRQWRACLRLQPSCLTVPARIWYSQWSRHDGPAADPACRDGLPNLRPVIRSQRWHQSLAHRVYWGMRRCTSSTEPIGVITGFISPTTYLLLKGALLP